MDMKITPQVRKSLEWTEADLKEMKKMGIVIIKPYFAPIGENKTKNKKEVINGINNN